MPQINQLLLVYQSQWFWLLLVLAVIYFGIAKGMLPKIEGVVEARNKRIATDLAAAERARAAADETEERTRKADEAAREEALSIAAKAKDKASRDADKRLAKADGEISGRLAEAEAKLASARAKALAGIEDVAADAAQDIVARVSGAKVTAAEAAKSVKAVMANG